MDVKNALLDTTPVKSAERVIAVLEMFDRERRPLALREICAQFGYPPSSGAAILKSLVTLGYLEYDRPSRTYFPTMRIAFLGSWIEGALFGQGELLNLMKKLQDATQETVVLVTQSDLRAQYVHVISSNRWRPVAQPGTLRPLTGSGAGLMLLSKRSDQEIDVICRRIDARAPGSPRVDRRNVMQLVNAARRDGFLVATDLPIEGGTVIAMPLPMGPFGRNFALGVGGATASIELRQANIVHLMREHIGRLGENMAPAMGKRL